MIKEKGQFHWHREVLYRVELIGLCLLKSGLVATANVNDGVWHSRSQKELEPPSQHFIGRYFNLAH